MEPASRMSGMSSVEDLRRRFERSGFVPRAKQFEVAQYVQDHYQTEPIYNVVLPTGYGKSNVLLLAYHVLRYYGRVSRALVVVPTDTQRRQYVCEIETKASAMGLDISGVEYVDGSTRNLRAHRQNKAEIFVVTAQTLVAGRDSGGVPDLLETGRWLIVADEYHKLNTEAAWGKKVSDLQHDYLLGMTATQFRSDGSDTVFANVPVCVEASLEEAYKEKAIRGVIAHIEHYFIDVIDETSQEVVRLTTEELRGEPDFNNYMQSRRLRLLHKYYSSMLISGAECLRAKLRQHKGQHQMVVFCMSVAHAKDVCATLNVINGKGFADWVGVGQDGRPDKENISVLHEFKENRLACLVQVDKAGEGFDNPRASVLVFLNILGRQTVKARQQIGRGIRRNHGIRNFLEDVCDVFCSPDTDFSDLAIEFANRTVGAIEASRSPEGDDGRQPVERDSWLPPELPPFAAMFQDAEFDREEVFSKVDDMEVRQVIHALQREGKSATKEDIRSVILELRKQELVAQEQEAQRRKPEEMRRAVSDAVATLASTVVRITNQGSFTRDKMGDVIRAIHAFWKRSSGLSHDAMMPEEFERKYEWVRAIHAEVRNAREVPQWLRL